jgi:hypothetical protein
MSAGVTDGQDLTVETLEFIDSNWSTVAGNFSEASGWDKPVLRNHDNKTLYPSGETNGYTAQLRNNDVVTVQNGGRTDTPTGTEFDFDITWEVDVTCEALPTNGFSVIGDTTDWRVFVHIVRRSILTDRQSPITDPDCNFDWRWITIANESELPEAEENRDYYGTSVTCRWHGYESLPAI